MKENDSFAKRKQEMPIYAVSEIKKQILLFDIENKKIDNITKVFLAER